MATRGNKEGEKKTTTPSSAALKSPKLKCDESAAAAARKGRKKRKVAEPPVTREPSDDAKGAAAPKRRKVETAPKKETNGASRTEKKTETRAGGGDGAVDDDDDSSVHIATSERKPRRKTASRKPRARKAATTGRKKGAATKKTATAKKKRRTSRSRSRRPKPEPLCAADFAPADRFGSKRRWGSYYQTNRKLTARGYVGETPTLVRRTRQHQAKKSKRTRRFDGDIAPVWFVDGGFGNERDTQQYEWRQQHEIWPKKKAVRAYGGADARRDRDRVTATIRVPARRQPPAELEKALRGLASMLQVAQWTEQAIPIGHEWRRALPEFVCHWFGPDPVLYGYDLKQLPTAFPVRHVFDCTLDGFVGSGGGRGGTVETKDGDGDDENDDEDEVATDGENGSGSAECETDADSCGDDDDDDDGQRSSGAGKLGKFSGRSGGGDGGCD